MKNLLNLKQTVWKQSIITQLRRSNDGQTTVKRRSRLMSIICLFLLLTLGVGQMWAASEGSAWWSKDSQSNAHVYFDNTSSSYANVSMLIGRQWNYGSDKLGSWGINFSLVSGTNNLYYANVKADKYTTFCFINATNWSWEENTVTARLGYCTNTDTPNDDLGSSTHLYVPASGSDNASVTHTTPSSYTSLNYTQTLNQTLSTDGGKTFSTSTAAIATVKVQSKKLNGNSSTIDASGTISSGSSSTSCAAARTATVTYTVSSVATGYEFVGWYDGSTQKSTSTTYTYNATGAKTITARFKQKQYTVSYGVNSSTRWGSIKLNSGSAVTTTSSSTLNHGTAISFTATPNSGYQVEGWYSDASCTAGNRLQEGGTSYNAGTLTAAKTVYVKFKVRTGGTITLSAGSNGQVSADNSTWGTTKTITDVTTATDVNIYARGNTGYQFSSWTKSSGSGTIKTNAASGVFTTVAYEDATVTASFTENKSTITVTTATFSQGTLKFGGSSKSWGATASLGVATTQSITATAAAGFRFVRWELTGAAATSSSTTSATIILKADGSGSTGTATAVFEEDLSTPWTIKGGIGLTGNNWTTAYNMTKKTGHSTESVAYYTFSVSAANIGDSQKDNYGFKLLQGETWYGAAADGDSYWVKGTTSNIGISTSNDKNIQIRANVAGNYEVKVDYSTPSSLKVTVTFPTTYTVTYSVSPASAADAITTSPSVTSGGLVVSGTSVAFTHAAAKEGYTWSRWENGSGTSLGTGNTYTTTINANTTVVAKYTENDYTVTVTAGEGGTVASASVTGHKDTKVTLPTATPNSGYYFTGWTTTTGTVIYTNETSASSAKVNGLTAAATVQANFAPIWRLVGSMNCWNEGTNPLLNYSTEGGKNYVYVEVSLNANTQYSFKVKDVQTSKMYKPTSSNTEITYANKATAQGMNNTAAGDPNQTIMTAAAGTYRFTWNITDKSIKVTYPASYKVTFGKGTGGASISASGSTTGAITSGKYVAKGENVTFAQTASTGYTFAGWYSAASDGSAVPTMAVNDNVLNTIAADATVYSRYTENMTTVALSATNGKIQYWDGDSWEDAASSVNVGVATHCSIKAVPATGYYFAGWVNTEGTDYEITGSFNNEDDTNTTLKGKGIGETTGQTLTANFVELEKVYFRNWNEDSSEPLWKNVYAYFSISYEDNCAKSNSSSDYSGILMTREGTSNVYWAYVPRGTTRNNDDNIAFSNHKFGTNYKFYNEEAVMRGDYKTGWDMFVPQHSSTSTVNSTTYYNGYWKHHNVAVGTDAGYRIERYNGSGYVDPVDNGDGSEHHRDFTVGSENTIIYQLRIDNLTSGYNNYRIYNEGGTHYITFGESVQETGYTLTNTDCSNIGLSEYNSGSPRFYITPTSEGIYTLTIDMSGDVMRLSVNYPVAIGDYQLIHSYNDGTAKLTRSDVIKTTDERQYSMYIDNTTAHSPSLVLKKCTGISEGNPVWSTGTAVNMAAFTTDTKGVYVFDVAIDGDAATLKNIEPYRGNYYIKTDVAKGGWTSYTENAMEENTINATDFDYYYCKYIGSVDTNIKCVIANDYCNAVSDTLEGDDVIGAEVQTMPYAGNVRFSYNSATNELKRAYINGSSDWERYFLELQAGSAVIKAGNGSYFTDNKVKFTDNGNWIYHLELQAQEGARVKLVAHYYNGTTTKDQYFKGAYGEGSFDDAYTEELIGSTGESSWLGLSIIYDFKTNYLIAAWSPSGSIDATINLNTDVLLIHNRKVIESAGDEVSMIDLTDTNGDGVYGDVKNINKVFSALRFLKESDGTYIGMTGTPGNAAESYYRYNYWISFPYDVKMTDIFGISGYGSKWRIQYYDGAERADKGWYLGDGTTTFWKTMTMSDDTKLEKGRGYVLQLSPSAFQATGSGSLWELSDEIYLYFPSQEGFGNIGLATSSVSLSSLPCTKGLYTDGSGKNHNLTDSHWHVFGIPTFKNATGTTGTGDNYYDGEDAGTEQEAHTISGDPFYFYMYNNDGTTYNTYTVTSSSVSTFQPMHAYMIQMTGTLNFAINSVPASVAARQKKEIQNYDLRLELSSDGQVADQTFVTLRENAVADFALNEDLTKIHNTGKANIYSYAGVYDVAANILPVENRTVVLGVETAKAGTYTFSMPDNFDGIVTLIDNFTQTRTNLALGDYEVSLPKGEMNDRFLLEINIRQVPTAIDGVEGGSLKDGKAHKYIENGAMYILRDGKIYDARGNKVK